MSNSMASMRNGGGMGNAANRVFFVTVRARISAAAKTLSGTALVLETLPPRRASGAKDTVAEKMKEKAHECAGDSPFARVSVSFDDANSAVIFEVKDPLPPEEREGGGRAAEKAEAEKNATGLGAVPKDESGEGASAAGNANGGTPATPKRAMTITIAATGYITTFDPRVPAKDQQVAVWQPILSKSPFFSASQQFVLQWEDAHQQALFGIVGLDYEHQAVSVAQGKATKFVMGKAKKRLMKASVFAVFSSYTALWGTLELPLYAVWASDAIDNSFASLRARSKLAGRELAAALLAPDRGNRPVTLTGYSFGANVMFECLIALYDAGALGVVEDVFLLGACLETDRERWRKARQACGGRLVNVFNRNDWHLWMFHRVNTLGSRPLAGMCPVSLPGVENVDVSAVISAHGDYALHLSKAFDHIPPQPTPETCRVNTGGSAVGARVPAADILNAADRVLDAMSTSVAVMLDCGFVLSYTNRLVVDASTDYAALWAASQNAAAAAASNQSGSVSAGLSAEAMAATEEAQSLSGDVSLVFIGEVCYGCQFDFSPPPMVDTCEAGVAGLLCPIMSKAPCCVAGFAVHMGALSDTILVVLVFLVFDASPIKHEVRGACKGLIVPARERPDEDAAQLGRRLRRIVEHYAADPAAIAAFAKSTNSFTTIVDVPISPLPELFQNLASYAATPSSDDKDKKKAADSSDDDDEGSGSSKGLAQTRQPTAASLGASPPMPKGLSSLNATATPAILDATIAGLGATAASASAANSRPLASMAEAIGMDLHALALKNNAAAIRGGGGGHVDPSVTAPEEEAHETKGDEDVAETILPGIADPISSNGKKDPLFDAPETCPIKIAWTWRDNHFTLAVSGILSRQIGDLLSPGEDDDEDEDGAFGTGLGLLDPMHMAALRLEAPPIGRYLDADAIGSCATLLPLDAMHAGVVQLRRALCAPPADVLGTEDAAVIAMVLAELGNACHRSCGFTVNGAVQPLASVMGGDPLDSTGSGGSGFQQQLRSVSPNGSERLSLTRRGRADLFEATLSAIQRRTVVLLQPIVIANCSSNNAPLCLPEDSLSLLAAADGFQWLRMPPPVVGPGQCTMLAFRWRVDPYSVFKAEAERVMYRSNAATAANSRNSSLAGPPSPLTANGGGSGHQQQQPSRPYIKQCQVLLSSFSFVDLPPDGKAAARSTYLVRIIATLRCEDIVNKPLVTTSIAVSCLVDTADDRHRQSVACFTKGLPEEETTTTVTVPAQSAGVGGGSSPAPTRPSAAVALSSGDGEAEEEEWGEDVTAPSPDSLLDFSGLVPTAAAAPPQPTTRTTTVRYEAMQYPCLMIPAGGAAPLRVVTQRDAPDSELDWLFLDKKDKEGGDETTTME